MLQKLKNKPLSWYLAIPVMAARVVRFKLALARDRRIDERERREEARIRRGNPGLSPWRYDQDFKSLMNQCSDSVIVDTPGIYMLQQLARQTRFVPGDVAELGVFQGGTAKVMAILFESVGKTIHLFDTFEGMPKTGEKDLHNEGDFNDTSLNQVTKYLHGCANIQFHPGFFPATAGPVVDTLFAFVHLDADIYQSTKDGLEFFYPRMNPGGVIVMHDYNAPTCPGVNQAVDEFFKDKPEVPIASPTNQCFVFKLPQGCERAQPASPAATSAGSTVVVVEGA